MAGPLLSSEPLQRYRALGLAGDPVWRAARQLRAAITQRLSAEHADLLQVADRSGDPGRAHVQRRGQLDRGHPAVVVDQQRGEHPGGEPGQPSLGERAADPLDGGLLGGRHGSHSTGFRII